MQANRLPFVAAIVTAFVLISSATALAQPNAIDTELERLRGHWQVVEMIDDGNGIPENQMQQWLPGGGVFEIVDYTILFQSPIDGSKTTKTFRLDPTSYPKRIAILERDTTKGMGIYKYDQGKLVVCIARGSAKSPNDFSATQGSNRTLLVMERFEPGRSVPGLNAALPQQAPVEMKAPVVPQPQLPPPPQPEPIAVSRQPLPQQAPQPSPAVIAAGEASRILTDDDVRNMTFGRWRMNDTEGSIDIVFDPNGTFQTYRYYRTLANFQFVFVPTPISTGNWSIVDGRLIANVTASTRRQNVNQSFVPAVRSISNTDMILVDHLGRVSRAVKMR